MTLYEAYLKAKAQWDKYGSFRLYSCSDYGDRWGFEFVPSNYDEDDRSTWFGGGGDTTVNKQTGEIGVLVMQRKADAEIIATGKPISIEQFTERAAVA